MIENSGPAWLTHMTKLKWLESESKLRLDKVVFFFVWRSYLGSQPSQQDTSVHHDH